MKKKSGFLKFIISMPFGIILLVIGSILIYTAASSYINNGSASWGLYRFDTPTYICRSENGYTCVIDAEKNVFIKDEYDASWLLDAKDFGYKSKQMFFGSAVFDEADNLYIYYSVYEENSYTTKYDVIARVNVNDMTIQNVVQFDYSSSDFKFNRSDNIKGLSYSDDAVHFLKSENDLEYAEYTYSVSNDGYEKSENYSLGYRTIRTARNAGDLGYAVILNDSSIGYLKDGEFQEICKGQVTDILDENDLESRVPASFGYIGSEIYVVTTGYEQEVYRVTENGYELAVDTDEICQQIGMDEIQDGEFFNCRVFDNGGKIGLVLNNVIVYDVETLDVDDGVYFVSLKYMISSLYRKLGAGVGVILVIAGIIITFGGFVKWRMSILTKQLLVTIPIVAFAFLIIATVLFVELYFKNDDDLSRTMTSIGKIGVQQLDGDEIEKIRSYDYVDDGTVYKYYQILTDMIEDNQMDWSNRLSLSILLYEENPEIGDLFVTVTSSANYDQPFLGTYSLDGLFSDSEELRDESIGYMNMISFAELKKYYVSDIAIRNSAGDVVAVLEVSTDNDDFTKELLKSMYGVGFTMLFMLIVIIVLVSVFSYINVRNLHNASEVVSVIASGNFARRIEKTGRDEVGDICRGVNDMADKLDMLFKEKDENEQFYYKFVPEQFKDLLHKDKFTQLSLGDAESVDLTVLFCDIRSFSLNSEMMTAKENFEFINVIYGIAGPIIRKHNGFVDKYIGDALMALFENADDAIACGRELYHSIALDASTAQRLHISSINIGIGIHTGMARIGIVGEEERMSGTVISNTVNLSSRLESITKQYDTAMIISKDTLDRVSDPDSINTRYLGMIQVAGVNEVKALYEVLDCLDEERYSVREANKAVFKEAVRLYHLGNLKESLAMFESIAKDIPTDPAIKTYIEYIRTMLESGSGDSKVFRFTRK